MNHGMYFRRPIEGAAEPSSGEKLNELPTVCDARHLRVFMKEYRARRGRIVCATPRPMIVVPGVTAVPWRDLPSILVGLTARKRTSYHPPARSK
jgi:hypothetical protein